MMIFWLTCLVGYPRTSAPEPNKVVVPEAFFKVVLRMGDYPQAIGFICRNQSQKGRKKTDFVNSIDEVERITGYDFFSKLPDNIENKVEAKADMNEW